MSVCVLSSFIAFNVFRVEISFRGCVHNILGRDVGCTKDDVVNVMRRDDVRTGLLDSISLNFCGKYAIFVLKSPMSINVILIMTQKAWVRLFKTNNSVS